MVVVVYLFVCLFVCLCCCLCCLSIVVVAVGAVVVADGFVGDFWLLLDAAGLFFLVA